MQNEQRFGSAPLIRNAQDIKKAGDHDCTGS